MPEDSFRDACQVLIEKYQNQNLRAKTSFESLTVRELQEQALQFLLTKIVRWEEQDVVSSNFISTSATKKSEEEIKSVLKIRALQRDKKFPHEAVGVNGILLEGDSGSGKSEMIRAIFQSQNIQEATDKASAQDGITYYYKIDASQTLERKKETIIKAFEKGAVIWIDELNSCIDDGLEKILNAVLTGAHPDTGKKADKAGFTMVASINQISMEGRSSISPALLHRIRHQKTKSLQEYSTQDLSKIIRHWISDKKFSKEEDKSLIATAIAIDFGKIILSENGKDLNLRTLKQIVGSENFLQEYQDHIKSIPKRFANFTTKVEELSRKKEPNFKEKDRAISEFIERELSSLSEESRKEIDPFRRAKFLDVKDKLVEQYTLDGSKVRGFKKVGGKKVGLAQDDWKSDASNPNSYLALKEKILRVEGADKIFKFNDDKKVIQIYASAKTLSSMIDSSIKESLAATFSQFKKPYKSGDEATIFGLRSEASIEIKKTEIAEMSKIAGHEVIFTKAELEQELFFRQKDIKKPIPAVSNFSDLLSHSFCIGEFHDHKSSKRILIENMADLNKRGYKTIFLEGLVYDSIEQKLLDEYFSGKEMSPLLESKLKNLDKANKTSGCGYFEVVKAAKEHGLKVVGIESEYSHNLPGWIDDPKDNKSKRWKDMNYAACSIISERVGGEKWVAIMGNAHMKTSGGVTGIGEIMGVPSVYIYDSTKSNVTSKFSKEKVRGVESEVRIGCPDKASLRFTDLDPKCAFSDHNSQPKKGMRNKAAQEQRQRIAQEKADAEQRQRIAQEKMSDIKIVDFAGSEISLSRIVEEKIDHSLKEFGQENYETTKSNFQKAILKASKIKAPKAESDSDSAKQVAQVIIKGTLSKLASGLALKEEELVDKGHKKTSQIEYLDFNAKSAAEVPKKKEKVSLNHQGQNYEITVEKFEEDQSAKPLQIKFGERYVRKIFEKIIFNDSKKVNAEKFGNNSFANCIFEGCDLAKISGKAMKFANCAFDKDCILPSRLENIDFSGCKFSKELVEKMSKEMKEKIGIREEMQEDCYVSKSVKYTPSADKKIIPGSPSTIPFTSGITIHLAKPVRSR